MKLRALIERLEEIETDLQQGLGDEVEPEVIVVYQENYPLTGTLLGVTVLEDDVEIQTLTSVDRATLGETRVKRGA